MTLADMSVITAEVKVDETDIVNVHLGQPAEVTIDAIPRKIFSRHGFRNWGQRHRTFRPAWPPSQQTYRQRRSQRLQGGGDLDRFRLRILRPGLSDYRQDHNRSAPATCLAIPIQALFQFRSKAQLEQEKATPWLRAGPRRHRSKSHPKTRIRTRDVQGVFVIRSKEIRVRFP